MSKKRAILISDIRGWAFDRNMHDLAEALVEDFEFTHFYITDWFQGHRPKWTDFDVVFEVFHRNPPMGIPYNRTVGSLRSQWFDPAAPALPTAADIAVVNRYRGFQVTTYQNYAELSPTCPRAAYLTNPIATHRFKQVPLRAELVASWNGNTGHVIAGRSIKRFHEIVIPACKIAGVSLVAAEYNTSSGPFRKRSFEEMPAFYQQASVALCASEYEGASYSVMEGMASGLALIATDVGNHREMRDSQFENYGDSGILIVDPSVEAFAQALRGLTPERTRKMGEINRAEIEARWSWNAWAPRYRDFLNFLPIPPPTVPTRVRPTPRPPSVLSQVSVTPIPSPNQYPVISLKKATPTQVLSVKSNPPPSKSIDPASVLATDYDFAYWNGTDPDIFLADDITNPSRNWAGRLIESALDQGLKTVAEIGPGAGADYAHQFKPLVSAGKMVYTGFEGSSRFCASLRRKHPESTWENTPIAKLPERAFDIAYARHVLEHQPALEPSLSCLLGLATKLAVIVWYRPPAAEAVREFIDGVYYCTFSRSDVLAVIAREGWKIVEEVPFASGNLGWRLEPTVK